METFIKTKRVLARPMTKDQWKQYAGVIGGAVCEANEDGYLVEDVERDRLPNHPDHEGRVSWVPKRMFEASYHKASGGNAVTQEDVNNAIQSVHVETLQPHDKPVTFVEVRMQNGFTIRETATSVDPKCYSEEIGADVCMMRIKERIWMLLGYELQSALATTGGAH